ncbi:MAG: hypothetical protein ABTD50_09925 [Polyangiaceae bacterium]|jgi:hypothetical protein
MSFGADSVSVDPRTQTLETSGHVRVDEPPFHLASDALWLRRTRSGVLVDGTGRLAFCPCLGTPLAIRFTGATIAPPHDIVVRNPVVEIFGMPVAWAPAWWLRSPGRAGLLAPDVAWRGSDGLRLGTGVHVPWADSDQERGIDLRASGYVDGGALVDAALRTTRWDARIQWDRLHAEDGLVVFSHGSTQAAWGPDAPLVVWDVDAMRGDRAVRSASDVEAASRPFDRAEAAAAWSSHETLWVSGLRSVALRGGPLGAFGATGPYVAVRKAGALGTSGDFDASFEAGFLAEGEHSMTRYARAESDALLARSFGPFDGAVALRALGAIADDGFGNEVDGAAHARVSVALPLGREFASRDPGDPWLHVTEPRFEAAAIATDPGSERLSVPDRGLAAPRGAAGVVAATWNNALSRWGARSALAADVSVGALTNAERTTPVARAHLAAHDAWFGGDGELARVLGGTSPGGALLGGLRAGPEAGLHFGVHVAERDRVDPVSARALVDPLLEAAGGFLAAAGWSGGVLAEIPLGARLAVRGGADADLDRRTLVATMGTLEAHDSCRCLVARLTASRRLGREGVDVWLTVDLAR